MRTTQRVGAATLGAVTVSGAVLLLTPGLAVAQQGPPETAPPPRPCRPAAYPPQQCRVVGGAGRNAPPLVVGRTLATPGTAVAMRVRNGCAPGRPVTLALLNISTGAKPVVLQTLNANPSGGYDTSVTIPSDTRPGVYILYSECTAADLTDTVVSTRAFVVVPAGSPVGNASGSSSASSVGGGGGTGNGNGSTNGNGSRTNSGGATSSDAPAETAAIAAADLPESWSAPTTWDASEKTKAAVTDAVNLRLAALRTSLPADAADSTAAPAAAPAAAPSPTDLTPWYAAAGAVALVALGAAGRRRRTAAGENDTNGEPSA